MELIELRCFFKVEWHPHYHDIKLKEFCEKEGIILQAYSSLGGSNNAKLLSDPQVVDIAQKLGKSKAQVNINGKKSKVEIIVWQYF